MDLKRTAREVLENVGGEENIISIMSCFTRVRVELKDKTKVDEKKLKEADGCQGVNWVGNTVQIIFGGRCNDVYDELEKIVHITETEANGEKSIVKKQSVWAVVIGKLDTACCSDLDSVWIFTECVGDAELP